MPWLRHQDADVLKSTWWRSAPTQQSRCPRSCEYAWVESQLHWMGGQGFLKRKWKTPGQKTGQGQRTYIWEVPNITFKYLQHHWIPVKVQEQHGKSNISVDHFWTEYPRVPRAISLLENRWTHLVKKKSTMVAASSGARTSSFNDPDPSAGQVVYLHFFGVPWCHSILVFGYGAVPINQWLWWIPPQMALWDHANFETQLDEFWYDSQNLQEEARSSKLV